MFSLQLKGKGEIVLTRNRLYRSDRRSLVVVSRGRVYDRSVDFPGHGAGRDSAGRDSADRDSAGQCLGLRVGRGDGKSPGGGGNLGGCGGGDLGGCGGDQKRLGGCGGGRLC